MAKRGLSLDWKHKGLSCRFYTFVLCKRNANEVFFKINYKTLSNFITHFYAL